MGRGEASESLERSSYLITNDWLFYGCEILEGREEDVAPLRAADVLDEAAEFLAQGDENFVFVLNRLCMRGVSTRDRTVCNFYFLTFLGLLRRGGAG